MQNMVLKMKFDASKISFSTAMKDKRYDLELFDEIQASFRALPLASVIDSKVLVLHGGLFSKDGVTLKDINL